MINKLIVIALTCFLSIIAPVCAIAENAQARTMLSPSLSIDRDFMRSVFSGHTEPDAAGLTAENLETRGILEQTKSLDQQKQIVAFESLEKLTVNDAGLAFEVLDRIIGVVMSKNNTIAAGVRNAAIGALAKQMIINDSPAMRLLISDLCQKNPKLEEALSNKQTKEYFAWEADLNRLQQAYSSEEQNKVLSKLIAKGLPADELAEITGLINKLYPEIDFNIDKRNGPRNFKGRQNEAARLLSEKTFNDPKLGKLVLWHLRKFALDREGIQRSAGGTSVRNFLKKEFQRGGSKAAAARLIIKQIMEEEPLLAQIFENTTSIITGRVKLTDLQNSPIIRQQFLESAI